MDIAKYKILFDLPTNYNALCKKYNCTYQHIYQVIKELVKQNLVEINNKNRNNIMQLTEQGTKAAQLLQDIFIITGEIKKLDNNNNNNIIKGTKKEVTTIKAAEVDNNSEIQIQQFN